MSELNERLREEINKEKIAALKNRSFSVIASNCNGAFICHDLHMRFNSPFVNLWLRPDDFIKFLGDITYYIQQDLIFTREEGIDYPVGLLENVKIYFQHYQSEADAKEKWNERKKRINLDNLFVIFTDRDGCTYEQLKTFDALPLKNKVVFCHKPYPEIKSACYIPGFEKEESVGMCFEFKNEQTGERYYDAFDYVKWFNGGR